MFPKNWHHIHYDTVDSTMQCCRTAEVSEGDFLLVTADEQTAGRGQRGNHWESEKGQNLTFNIVWNDLGVPANQQFILSEITALAVVETLQDTIGDAARVTVKWPNDIYADDRKICGMLLEHSLAGKTILRSTAGIGININQRIFRSDAPNPVSLFQILGTELDRWEILRRFVNRFSELVTQLQDGQCASIEHSFTTLLYRREGWHRFADSSGEFLGQFVRIARNGILTLRKADGTEHDYAFKEVQFLLQT